MINTSLVFGTRRYNVPFAAIVLAVSAAAVLALRGVIPESTVEPLSLILLGVSLALGARRLRQLTGLYDKNFRTGSSHGMSTPPVSGN